MVMDHDDDGDDDDDDVDVDVDIHDDDDDDDDDVDVDVVVVVVVVVVDYDGGHGQCVTWTKDMESPGHLWPWKVPMVFKNSFRIFLFERRVAKGLFMLVPENLHPT